MRWTAYVSGVGLLLAGVVSTAPAQMPRSATSGIPRSGGTYYTPYTSSPPCATPHYPHGAPAAPPGAMMPGTVVSPPGAAMPPSTTPTPPGAPAAPGAPQAPAAPAPADAAAPGTADPGAGAGGERGSDALASAAPQMIGDLSSSGFAAISRSSTGPRVPIGARS